MTWKKIVRNLLAASTFFLIGAAIFLIESKETIWVFSFNFSMGGFVFLLGFRVILPIWATIVYRLSGNKLPGDVQSDFILKVFVIKPNGGTNV